MPTTNDNNGNSGKKKKSNKKKSPRNESTSSATNTAAASSASGPAGRRKSQQQQRAEDEAYAQALQDEYRQQFLKRQARKNKASKQARKQQQQQQDCGGAPYASAPPESDLLMLSTTNPPPSHVPPPPTQPSYTNNSSNIPRAPYVSISPPPHSQQSIDDEQYARQVQMELEQHQQQQQQQSSQYQYNPYGSPVRATPVTTSTTTPTDDLALAQRLQQEEYAAQTQRLAQLQQQAVLGGAATTATTATATTTNSSSSYTPTVVRGTSVRNSDQRRSSSSSFFASRQQSDFLDERDDDIDRRIAQELQDAEMAAQLSRQQQNRVENRRSQQLQRDEALAQTIQMQTDELAARQAAAAAAADRPKKSCFRRMLPLMVAAAALAVIPVLFVTGVFDTDDFPGLGDIFGGDTWQGNTTTIIDCDDFGDDCGPVIDPATAYAWSNNGNGIELPIIVAVSDDWVATVNEATTNWENGYPIDSLTLPVDRVAHEPSCQARSGVMKVCNGNYGNTRWRGLNEVMLSGRNRIRSSTAKLNDYYLQREGPSQRLYTACHEMGHGFGLPHWDENFYNADLGNCMDYTTNPGQNSRPDRSTFLYLAQLYGGRNVTDIEQLETPSASAQEDAVPPGGGRRHNRNRRQNRNLKNRGRRMNANSSRTLRSSIHDHLPTLPHHQRRRVIVAAEDHEVHVIENVKHSDLNNNVAAGLDDHDLDGDGDERTIHQTVGNVTYTIIQHYLLYVPWN